MLQSAWASGVHLARYAPAARMDVHVHDDASLCLLVAGGYAETTRGREDRHRPGDMMFCPAHEPHSQRFAADGALKIIFRPRIDAMDYLRGKLALESAPFAGSPRLLAIGRRMAAELDLPNDETTRLVLEGLALEALGEFGRAARAPAHDTAWISRAREFVEANACKGFTLAAMAQALDRHPVHVARSFRAAFGSSVGDATRELRLARAARLLRQSSRPIGEIALECGFSDQAHLTRRFKTAYGVTPARYRRAR